MPWTDTARYKHSRKAAGYPSDLTDQVRVQRAPVFLIDELGGDDGADADRGNVEGPSRGIRGVGDGTIPVSGGPQLPFTGTQVADGSRGIHLGAPAYSVSPLRQRRR